MRTAKILIRLGECPADSLLGAQVILFVLSCSGSYVAGRSSGAMLDCLSGSVGRI